MNESASEFLSLWTRYQSEVRRYVCMLVPLAADAEDVMQELDWGIGELMRALTDKGIARNTIVIFTSDNGPMTNEYARPFRDTKYVTLEGGHRVPFILHWPEIMKRGSVSDVPVNAMDLFPTLSQIIDRPLPSGRTCDGESLLPLMQGQSFKRKADQPFFYYNCENLQAIRAGDWKLHLTRSGEQLPFWEKNKAFTKLTEPVLFNLRVDQAEAHDVAAEHPEIVKTLRSYASKTREELGEYMHRGTGQRPTGSIVRRAPIISHEKGLGRRQRRHATTD